MKINLNEFHEKMDIFSVKLAGEVLNGLVKILRQRVELSSDGELGLPYVFYVLPRRHLRHFREKRVNREETNSLADLRLKKE